jgi:hypothetical protein
MESACAIKMRFGVDVQVADGSTLGERITPKTAKRKF